MLSATMLLATKREGKSEFCVELSKSATDTFTKIMFAADKNELKEKGGVFINEVKVLEEECAKSVTKK